MISVAGIVWIVLAVVITVHPTWTFPSQNDTLMSISSNSGFGNVTAGRLMVGLGVSTLEGQHSDAPSSPATLGVNSSGIAAADSDFVNIVDTQNQSFPGIPEDKYEVASLKLSPSDLKALYGAGMVSSSWSVAPAALPLFPPQPLPPVYQPTIKYAGYVHPVQYTRVKLGYGTFYYNGREAELRCQFPYNLRLVSNLVWNKVSDNLVHYLDSYRIYDRTVGHTSSLHIRDVLPKDFGIYSCAVTGSFFGGHPVTYYQEIHFFPPAAYPDLHLYHGKRK